MDLITIYGVEQRVMISGFREEMVAAVTRVKTRQKSEYPMIVALKNAGNLPDSYETVYDGVNISATHLTQDIVDEVKK